MAVSCTVFFGSLVVDPRHREDLLSVRTSLVKISEDSLGAHGLIKHLIKLLLVVLNIEVDFLQ